MEVGRVSAIRLFRFAGLDGLFSLCESGGALASLSKDDADNLVRTLGK